MDSRSGVKIFSLVLKMIVRQASPLVDTCEGDQTNGDYVRDNYSVLLSMALVYHIVVVHVI
jgi:hypothetical protein